MGDEPCADGEASDSAHAKHQDHQQLINVTNHGDIVLSVTFITSDATLKRSRKAVSRTSIATEPPGTLAPTLRIAYRVSLNVLTRHSQYFGNLLTNPSFREAQLISTTHAALFARKIKASEADPLDLPWVLITDDDEATQSAARQHALEDMLRIMHALPIKATRVVMAYMTTLAIVADRFDCTAIVARSLADLKFKWPVTTARPYVDEKGRTTEVEKVLRQKILVAWLLNQPMRLHQASRELLMRGSRLWGPYTDDGTDLSAAWWNLPESIEEELQLRRECILNTISSIQTHFIALYSSRDRQCKMGYDSSAACDSFQFGQMIKFFLSKNLLYMVDYSPASVDKLSDTSLFHVDDLLATLKQCPNYQVDKHHMNCGLRMRIDPILDYVKTMLAANVVSLSQADWKKRRGDVSWASRVDFGARADDGERRVFAFTRALANDQRLRYEGAMYADKMAKTLFTATAWDWTPEV